MTTRLSNLELAIGSVGSVIMSEHFFSTFLSSPWTTQKFVETEVDKEVVRRMYLCASLLSLLFAAGISYLIKEKAPLILSLILCMIYIGVYEKALNKEL